MEDIIITNKILEKWVDIKNQLNEEMYERNLASSKKIYERLIEFEGIFTSLIKERDALKIENMINSQKKWASQPY